MLGRFCLQFASARNEGQEREMDIDGVVARKIVLDLADCLEKRQPLDVAYGAADFAQHEVEIVVAVEDEVLDGVGDMRDHLDGRAEIVAAPFLGQNVLIDTPGGNCLLYTSPSPRD